MDMNNIYKAYLSKLYAIIQRCILTEKESVLSTFMSKSQTRYAVAIPLIFQLSYSIPLYKSYNFIASIYT